MGAKTTTIGAEVEVQSDDAGFRDAWHEATVVRSPRSASRRRRRGAGEVYVVYTSFVVEGDESKPLAEFVPPSHVRPRPPRPSHVHYALHQLVDAFHNDGWWAGVVSEVRGRERYSVCFPGSREEIQFGPSDLRPRLSWVEGRWVSPDESQVVAEFTEGDNIEVSGDKKNFGVVWYPGTIVNVIGNTVFQVEYMATKDDGDHQLVREILDAQYIRQIPPRPFVKQFGLQTKVEAFHQCGWFTGVVSKVLDNLRYIVKLKYQDEEMEFHISKLRAKPKWIRGSWQYTSANKGSKGAAHAGKVSGFPLPVSLSSLTADDTEAIYEQPLEMMVLNHNREKRPSIEGQAETSQPCKKRKERVSADHQLVEIGPKNLTKDTEHLASMPKLQVGPSSEFIIAASPSTETGLPTKHSFRERSCGKIVSRFKCLTELSSTGEGSSNFKLEGSEEQLKIPNFNHSSRRRTKLAVRGPLRRREAAGDVRDHAREGMEGQRGSCSKESKELQQLERTGVVLECEQTRGDVDKSNSISLQCPLDEPLESENAMLTSDVNRKKLQQLERTDVVLECEQTRGDVDKSISISLQCPLDEPLESENAMLTSDVNRDSSKSNANSIQVDTLDADPLMPPIDSLDRGVSSINCLTHSQLPNEEHSAVATSNSFSPMVQQVPGLCEQLNSSGKQADSMANLRIFTATGPILKKFSVEEENVSHNPPPMGSISSQLPNEEHSAVVISNSFNPVVQQVPGPCEQLNSSGKQADSIANLRVCTATGPISKDFSIEENVPHNPPAMGSISSQFLNEEHTAVVISNSFNPMVQQVQGPCEQLNSSGKANLRISSATGPISKNLSIEEENVSHNPPPPTGSNSALPFEKESPLWESIESMEIFRSMPQQPHFSELEMYSVPFREGMAIGMMVTFVNLVRHIGKLRILDSQAALVENLKELSTLEANGFQVQCVRSRMEELLEMGKNQKQSEEEYVTLKARIFEREIIKKQLDSLEALLDKTIMQGEPQLAHFREERKSVVLQMKDNESDIDGLKKELQKVAEAYLSAEKLFNAVVASPWE